MVFALVEVFGRFNGLEGADGVAFGVVVLLGFSVSLGAPFGMGRRNIVTLGSVRNSRSLTSIGKAPRGSGCTESCNS